MNIAKDQENLDDPVEIDENLLVHEIIYCVLLVLSIFYLVLACVTDPGIIPRGSDEKMQYFYSETPGGSSVNNETKKRYYILKKHLQK